MVPLPIISIHDGNENWVSGGRKNEQAEVCLLFCTLMSFKRIKVRCSMIFSLFAEHTHNVTSSQIMLANGLSASMGAMPTSVFALLRL